MIDYSASGLLQSAYFELLDGQRRGLGDLEGVLSAGRERNINSTPRTGGTLEMIPQKDINWLTDRVRFWGLTRYRGETETVPLFTGIPLITGQARGQYTSSVSLKLLDFSAALDVPLGANTGVSPGDVVTAKVRTMLAGVGATDAVITESSSTVSEGMFWDATQTKRRYVNDLLKTIGYSAVWADEWGRLRCEPYVDPAKRPVRGDLGFIHGKTCTYRPEFTIEHDTTSVPNHAVIVAQTMGNLEPVVGSAWLPASHPYSYESRGNFELPYSESSVDLAVAPLPDNPTQAQIDTYKAALLTAANAYAAQALQLRSAPSRSFQVDNRWRPFDLQEATRFVAPARGSAPAINTTVTVAKDSLKFTAGGPLAMSTTLQEVV